MSLSALRESSPMTSRPPQEMEEELLPAGREPGDSRAKPPVKPKPEPRTLPAKPALPAKPSLLVPVGPRPPRGPLAELPSARKMNMLAGPQPYGGSKRPLAFSSRPAPDAPSAGANSREAGKDEGPPTAPPPRCSVPAGVRKAPAPFRPLSDRFSTSTVEEILAKMEQPRKEGPSSPDRLWGSRLSFSQDGSTHYGPRAYGPLPSPREEETLTQSISGDLAQEEQGKHQEGQQGGQSPAGQCPAEAQKPQPEEASRVLEERLISSNLTSNGDLVSNGDLASAALPREVSRSSALPHPAPSPVPPDGSPGPLMAPGSQSPALPTEKSPESQKSFSPSFPSEETPKSPSSGISPEKTSSTPEAPGSPSSEHSQVTSSQITFSGGQLLEPSRTFPLEKKEDGGELRLRPPNLEQRRFSEGVLRPPSQDQRKLGGSLAALPQGQEGGGGLEQPFGSGTESNWSLSQSFEWTFPTRPSGLGVWRLESPPPSPITEADDSGLSEGEGDEAAGEHSSKPVRARHESVPCGGPQNQQGDGRSSASTEPPSNLQPKGQDSPRLLLLQAEEVAGTEEPLAALETPLPPTPEEEAASPVLEPVQEQEPPLPPAQPCILFADAPSPERATPSQEDAPDLAKAETHLTRPEGREDLPRASPDLRASENDAGWLDKLLASPPPSANGAQKAAVPEHCETQMPSASPEGLLGWAQKDLKSEFGIGADSLPNTFNSSSTWAREGNRGYGIGDSGSSERDWVINDGHGGAAQSHREWSNTYGIVQPGVKEEFDTSSGNQTKEHILGQDVMAQEFGKADQLRTYSSQAAELQDREFGKRDSLGRYSSRAVELQDQEFGKRDSLGTYSSQAIELQDQEFGKRDSLGTYSSQAVELQDQEFGKRDSLGTYSSHAVELQDQEFGKRDSLGTYSSHAVELQDQEFEKRDSLGTYGSQDADLHTREFEKRNWMSEYGGSSKRDADCLERAFGESDPSGVFHVGHSEQQDQEFGKKEQSGNYCSRETNQEEMLEKEPGGIYGPNTSNLQDQELGERALNSWSKSSDSNHQGEFGKRDPAGTYRSNDVNRQSREFGKKDWSGEFGQQDMSQTEREFSLGRRDWTSDFRIEGTEKSDQFGIIGTDRGSCSGLGILSGSDMMGSTNFVSPGKMMMGQSQWTDDLGLRNLDVSGCVGSEGLSETREHGVGQTDWSSNLGLRNMNVPSGLGSGGPGESRALGVGQKDWSPDLGLRNIDVSGVPESAGPSETRECGVGQTDWIHSLGMRDVDVSSDRKPGEPLLSREHGVGQADWTPDLKLRNTDLEAGGSLREHGVGQMDWTHDLGLRNMNLSSPLETVGSGEARECGVGQMDWQNDLGLRNTALSGSLDLGGPSEAREHGVGQVDWSRDVDLESPSLSSDLEGTELSETRELGVGEVSRPGISESQYGGDLSQPSENSGADVGMDLRETTNSGSSPGGCLARSPPSGSQGLLQDMLANSSLRASAGRERASSGPRGQPEEEEKEETIVDDDEEEPELRGATLPSCRPQPDGEASRTEEVDGNWASRGDGPAAPRLLPSPPSQVSSQDFSFIEDTEVLDSAMFRSRANLGRKRGHRAPAIRPGGTLGLSEAESDAWIFQDSTEPKASRVPSSDDEVVEEPQSRRTRMSLGTKGLKVNLFPGLSPSALKAKLRPRNRSAEEGEQVESKSAQKESAVQRSKSCKVPGLGKPLVLPPKPEKSSGSEGSSPTWLQALKLKKKRV